MICCKIFRLNKRKRILRVWYACEHAQTFEQGNYSSFGQATQLIALSERIHNSYVLLLSGCVLQLSNQ